MTENLFSEFETLHKNIQIAGQIRSLISWDQETYMPEESGDQRAEHASYFDTHVHQLGTNKRYGEVIDKLLSQKDLQPDQRRALVLENKKVRLATAIPEKLVAALGSHSVKSQQAWKKARAANDYLAFAPFLEKMIELKRETASLVKSASQTEFEAMVDIYEPEFPMSEIRTLFAGLRDSLVPLAKEIVERSAAKKSGDWSMDRTSQKKLNLAALELMGFNMKRGRLDEAAHPFCGGPGNKDVRLTTRFSDQDWADSLYSVLHEGGHGLYEQGMGQSVALPPLAEASSFGMHESQSRFWENCIGRSHAFAQFFVPWARSNFKIDDKITPEIFYAHVNTPAYSYIRVDADEATYNLHILIRFELEDALFSGKLSPKDMRDAWNEKVKSYLGLPAPTDADGVLQDVHWPMGAFGYFPSYTIGNLIAVQLMDKMKTEMPLEDMVRRGEFTPIRKWLYDNVHVAGSVMNTRDLVKKITGQSVRHEPFIQYLSEKFLTKFLVK